jgi:hypothetical protein
MANGSFYNYVYGSNNANYFGLYCEYTYAQSISGNYTDVTVDAYVRYYSINLNARDGTITVGGTSKSFTSPVIKDYPSGGGGKKKIGSTTIRVSHNNDGTKKDVKISVSWDAQITYHDTWYSTITASTTVNLPTIPRSSKIDSFTGTDLAGTFSVKYTSYYTGFTNKLRISIPNVKALETFTYTSGNSFSLSQATLDYLYSYTSTTDKVKLGAVIETWNGNTKIGESSELTHDCYVPGSIKPKFGEVSLDLAKITTTDGVSRDVLVKGKNKIAVSISGSEAGKGSNIKSYTYEVLSGSTVIAKTSTTSTSVTLGPFSHTGLLKFRVTVTDARNRSSNNSGSEPTYTCYDYSEPYFSNFDVYRANQDHSQNMNGTYIKCSYTPTYSSVGSTNNITVTAYYNGKSQSGTDGSILIDLNGDVTTTYKVYLSIVDNYGGTNKTSTVTIFGQARILNITSDGTGIAIGKMAESSELLECRWPAKFNDNLTVGISTQSSAPTSGIAVHDVRDAEITPDSFGDKNVNFYFDTISSAEKWYGILHMKGWEGDYAAWELAGNAGYSSDDNTLKYRQGLGDTWGDWQTVLTDKNGLPISGGTLTGKLTLGNDLYYASNNTAGLDCRNSDIINTNGIYFRDASDSAGESINFYRSDGYWDTIYAAGGALKFHPNRATKTMLNGYTVYNSNNFRTGTCTLYTNGSGTTVNFSSAMSGTPTIMLTPLTTVAGALPAKVLSRSTTGFTAIIGGDAITAGTAVTFMYLALCG